MLRTCIALAGALAVAAQADFFVIPVAQKIKNVVTVGQSGAQHRDLHSALAAIGDAGADNPYVVYVAPGVYSVTEPVVMKPYVSLVGSGRNQTVIRGAVSASDVQNACIVRGADHADLKHLSVVNEGGGERSIGVLNDSASPSLYDMDINVTNAQVISGIHNVNSANAVMEKINIDLSDAMFGYGVVAQASNPSLFNMLVVSQEITHENVGLYNLDSSPTLNDVSVVVLGGEDNCTGMMVDGSARPNISHLVAIAVKAGVNDTCYGLVGNGENTVARYSQIHGDGYGLHNAGAVFSTVSYDSTDAACTYCIDNGGTPLGGDCN